MATSLRRRIEQSDTLAWLLGGIVALWLRFCHATTRWDRQGDAELIAALRDGPVIVILWHESVMMGPPLWIKAFGKGAILRDTSPAGRLSGGVQRHFGMIPFEMGANSAGITVLRDVLRLVKTGVSLGITADGPKGPARVVKDAPLDWIKATGLPVFTFAYAMSRSSRASTWDRMRIALPFGRGTCIFRKWEGDVPRRADAATMSRIRADIAGALDQTLEDAERAVSPSAN
jgi:lysophospholipid acyltransferase (LPLAT)-like uncharacterized protein